jgi:hypothetical protein
MAEMGPGCVKTLRGITAPGMTPNHVRSDGSFPRKRSSGAGDGCTADHCQPGLLVVAELAPIADAGAGDRGICNGPKAAARAAKKIGSRPDMKPRPR